MADTTEAKMEWVEALTQAISCAGGEEEDSDIGVCDRDQEERTVTRSTFSTSSNSSTSSSSSASSASSASPAP